MFIEYYNSPIGLLKITANKDYLLSLDVEEFKNDTNPSALTNQVVYELTKYFRNELFEFSESFFPSPQKFREEVYKILRQIPYGTTVTYKQLAIILNKPKAARSIARILSTNPILIITPCHRVIGSDGTLKGFKAGLNAKKLLLDIEKNIKA